ncbi:MAG: tyrosine-type recombinase/integrase [Actinomycetota bacterium]|nr:tyrosine-type recombinase/integrase [Actinomycetota bacterium]
MATRLVAPVSSVRGELISPAHELVEVYAAALGSRGPGASSAHTARTYRGACERFAGWLVARAGAGAGAEELTLGRIGEYEDALRALGLSEATIRKDRSAVNGLVRFLADHDLIDRGQARLALARKLPSAQRGERERPKCLDDTAYRRLVTAAEARVATDALQGWRDVAIVRVLGDAGPRSEELLDLQRRDFLPKRQGAKLRALRIRHGKGNRRRTVELTPAAARAIREWDARRRELGPPPGEPDLPPSEWPLFCTLGRRRRDGSYTRLGYRASRDVVRDLLEVLGERAGVDEHLRHPHVLRHTFATRYYQRTGRLAELQRLLGHQDPKTTMVYVDDDPAERERLMLLASYEPTTLDLDREAA